MSQTKNDKIMDMIQAINIKKNSVKFYQVGRVLNDAPLWRTCVYDVNPSNWEEKKEIFRGDLTEVLTFVKNLTDKTLNNKESKE